MKGPKPVELAELDPRLREGVCGCCGHSGPYENAGRPVREDSRCLSCGASLRYRAQAEALSAVLGAKGTCLAGLVSAGRLDDMDIYEPGVAGPFRRLFRDLGRYRTSYFWPDVLPGQEHDGVRCEDLEALTLEDESFDLVITSDIFEHVRRPWQAFREVNRVLRTGGHHVLTVPLIWPLAGRTVPRVDVRGTQDVHVLPPVYHRSPRDPAGSLVYNDFGMDLPDRLGAEGFRVTTHHGFRNAVTIAAERIA
jgi:SAM-dependent methyltransferase